MVSQRWKNSMRALGAATILCISIRANAFSVSRRSAVRKTCDPSVVDVRTDKVGSLTRWTSSSETRRIRSTTLRWSPFDQQNPTDKVGKTLMLTGTGIEVTRAIIMGHLSTEELSEQMMDSMRQMVSSFDLEHFLLWTPILLAMGLAWESLSNPASNYRENKEPYPRGQYNPEQAAQYYQRHPYLVIQRLAEILRISNKFLWNMLFDKYGTPSMEKQHRPQRAQELLEVMTKLGPTAIKIGQALSVRPDLIPEEFSDALATLQDRVPPFNCQQAKAILENELGPARAKLFQSCFQGQGPVASASIGQVYKVRLSDKNVGRTVALKIQRPNVLAEIALDLYLVREFLAPLFKFCTGASSDLKSLANEWGRGFIAELDYRREASNTIQFNAEMKRRNIMSVGAPNVVSEYSTERVLVTEWVQGTRIDQSKASDTPRLCSVALNAYLVMLLELNSLHCDPHPGNCKLNCICPSKLFQILGTSHDCTFSNYSEVLCTPDGKLVILDFGMTLEIDPSLQYSLLEYVAHLTADDYDQLPEDLAKLGFLKEDKLEFARRSGVLEPLKYFLKQVGQGGGAQRFRERIMTEYRDKYPGMSDEQLKTAMRSEMQVRIEPMQLLFFLRVPNAFLLRFTISKEHIQIVADRESITTGITMEVEELQRQNRDSFQIPEWFLYTSRAFLTLEGVSLKADPQYSLIKSCFPYVAKRLVGDDDPRARQALRSMLYGAGENIDPKRVSELVGGFSAYTAATKTMGQPVASKERGEILKTSDATVRPVGRREKMQEAEAAITLAKDSADILLDPKGNLVQNLLVEEGVLAASARFKDEVRRSVLEGPERLRDALPFGTFLPPLPFEDLIKKQLEPFLRKTAAENNAQELAERLVKLLPQRVTNESDRRKLFVRTLRNMEPEHAALLLREIRENVPKYAPLVGQLGGKFASTLLKTASANIETALQELEAPNDMLRAAAKSLSAKTLPPQEATGPRIVPIADLGQNATIF